MKERIIEYPIVFRVIKKLRYLSIHLKASILIFSLLMIPYLLIKILNKNISETINMLATMLLVYIGCYIIFNLIRYTFLRRNYIDGLYNSVDNIDVALQHPFIFFLLCNFKIMSIVTIIFSCLFFIFISIAPLSSLLIFIISGDYKDKITATHVFLTFLPLTVLCIKLLFSTRKVNRFIKINNDKISSGKINLTPPRSVRIPIYIMYFSVLLGIIAIPFNPVLNHVRIENNFGFIFGFSYSIYMNIVFTLFLIHMTKIGDNWIRILFLFFAVVDHPIYIIQNYQYMTSLKEVILLFLPMTLQTISLFFLFRRDASEWFRVRSRFPKI